MLSCINCIMVTESMYLAYQRSLISYRAVLKPYSHTSIALGKDERIQQQNTARFRQIPNLLASNEQMVSFYDFNISIPFLQADQHSFCIFLASYTSFTISHRQRWKSPFILYSSTYTSTVGFPPRMSFMMERTSLQIYLIYFQMFSLYLVMKQLDLVLLLVSLDWRIQSALQAVLLEFILHLYAVDTNLISSSFIFLLPVLIIASMNSFPNLTISSQRQACYASLAKFMLDWMLVWFEFDIGLCLFIFVCIIRFTYHNKQRIIQMNFRVEELKVMLQQKNECFSWQIQALKKQYQVFLEELQLERQQHKVEIAQHRAKIDHYRGKCIKLNEKVKQQSDAIREFSEAKIYFQREITQFKHRIDKQKTSSSQIIHQLHGVIHLQDIQIGELSRKIAHLTLERQALQEEITALQGIKHKYNDLQKIGNNQYEQNITLLQQKLKLQFDKSTNQILRSLQNPQGMDMQHMHTIKKPGGMGCNQLGNHNQTQIQTQQQKELDDLSILKNYTEYGIHYFVGLTINELKLPQGKTIFNFIKAVCTQNEHLVDRNQELQRMIAEGRGQMSVEVEEMRGKLQILEDQLHHYRSGLNRTMLDACTQTDAWIGDIIDMNSILKSKLSSVITLMQHLSSFCIQLIKAIVISSDKLQYYTCMEAIAHKIGNGREIKMEMDKHKYKHKYKPKSFKAIAKSIYFIEILRSRSRNKHRNKHNTMSLQSIYQQTKHPMISRMLHKYFLKAHSGQYTPNYRIEEMMSSRYNNNHNPSVEDQLIAIIHQQTINLVDLPLCSSLTRKYQFAIEERINKMIEGWQQ